MNAPTLDAAWAEAEAALPEGQWMLEVIRYGIAPGDVNPSTGYTLDFPPEPYAATAGRHWSANIEHTAFGPTPAAALTALASRLRAAAGTPS